MFSISGQLLARMHPQRGFYPFGRVFTNVSVCKVVLSAHGTNRIPILDISEELFLIYSLFQYLYSSRMQNVAKSTFSHLFVARIRKKKDLRPVPRRRQAP